MFEFVQPNHCWPQPFSIEQAFGVLLAAIASTADVHGIVEWRGRHRTKIVDHLIGGGGFNLGNVVKVGSLEGLRVVFHRLVLGRTHDEIDAWRRDVGIDVTGTFEATFPHYAPFKGTPLQGDLRASEADVRRHLAWLLEGCRGKVLAVSLNPCHLQAREVGDVKVCIGADGFRFELEILLEGSHWFETLAQTRDGETFVATLDRAIDRMKMYLGEKHSDAASLCEALNRADVDTNLATSRGCYWVLGRRPVQQHVNHDRPVGRFVACAKIGYGIGGITVAELPSGRVVARDPTYDWKRMTMLRDILAVRFPPGAPPPTVDETSTIKETETVPVRPSHDALGRTLFDRDGTPLSEKALARSARPKPDSEIGPDHLF